MYDLTPLRRGQQARVAVLLDPARPAPSVRGSVAIVDGRSLRAVLGETSAFTSHAGDLMPPDGVGASATRPNRIGLSKRRIWPRWQAWTSSRSVRQCSGTSSADRLLLVQYANGHPDDTVVRPVTRLRGADQQPLIKTAGTCLDLGCDRTAAAAQLPVH